MKKTRFTWILIAALLVVTALTAAWHLTTRTQVAENALLIRSNGIEQTLSIGELSLVSVQGEISNAKGEVRAIDAQGVAVADVLRAANVSPESLSRLTVTAADAYSATLTAEDILQDANAWFILQDEGGVQMIVFSDSNSKRNVRNVQILEAE